MKMGIKWGSYENESSVYQPKELGFYPQDQSEKKVKAFRSKNCQL